MNRILGRKLDSEELQRYGFFFHSESVVGLSKGVQVSPMLPFHRLPKGIWTNELNTALRALVKEGNERNYVEVIKEANKGCSTDITLFSNPVCIPIEKDMK